MICCLSSVLFPILCRNSTYRFTVNNPARLSKQGNKVIIEQLCILCCLKQLTKHFCRAVHIEASSTRKIGKHRHVKTPHASDVAYEAIDAAGFSAQDSTSYKMCWLMMTTFASSFLQVLPLRASLLCGFQKFLIQLQQRSQQEKVCIAAAGKIFSIHFSSFTVRTKKIQMPKVDKII